MGTLKIGSAKNMVGVTIDPSSVLFNDNNVKYIKSGLTEIWSYIKPLVPTLTSNNNSDGRKVIASSEYNIGYAGYNAFSNSELGWAPASNTTVNSTYLQYNDIVPSCVSSVKIRYVGFGADYIVTFKLQGSNDGSTWVDLATNLSCKIGYEETYDFSNNNAYMYYKFIITNHSGNALANGSGYKFQLYGSQLKALIPTMTSNTTPSGVASASSVYTTDYDVWKAFDGNNSTSWNGNANSSDAWICYEFGSKKTLNAIEFVRLADGTNMLTDLTVDIQVLTDDNSWKTVQSLSISKEYHGIINLGNCISKSIRILQTSGNSGLSVRTIQVYG